MRHARTRTRLGTVALISPSPPSTAASATRRATCSARRAATWPYAGTRTGPEDSVVPNITPDKKTGIGRWRKREIAEYLDSGMTPDGDSAGDLMAEVIDRSTSLLTQADREAIATYLLSLPPIENAVRKERKSPEARTSSDFERRPLSLKPCIRAASAPP